MKRIFGLIMLCGCTIATIAQTASLSLNEGRWQKIILERKPDDIKMSSQLYQLAKLAAMDKLEANRRLLVSDLRHRKNDQRVNVEIVYRNDENIEKINDRISGVYIQSLGFELDQTWKNRASVWIKLEELLPKASLLPPDYFIFLVTKPRSDDEGPGVINSTNYKVLGQGGSGKRVAIFDGGFTDLAGAVTAGKAKTPSYSGIGGTASSVAGVNFSGSEHGTACVETVYDHVPQASFEVYANGNATDKGNAVADCIAHGVDVISMSQSEYNLGWFDNTGAACSYAQDAADAGLLFLTSCGNRAESHYEGLFKDDNTNGRHEFSGTDESNNLDASVPNNGDTHCYLSWNTSVGTDFDLYLMRTSDNAVLASSTGPGTSVSGFEYLSWVNNIGSSVGVYFRVVKVSGPNTTLEMFTHNAGTYQHAVAAGSNTSPSNSTDHNIISVGAVTHTSFDDASGTTGIIASYSSQGPTNSGNIAPKLTGPTNTTTRAYSGSFGGTSCATPNLAGAITSFWSANLYLDHTGVRQICFRFAQLYKDWGTAGNDNIYGYGGLYLYSWASGLRYMFRTSTNAAITNATRPYYSLHVAQNLAFNGATVIVLNGNYIETGLYGVAGAGNAKRILYRYPFTGSAGYGY